MSSPPRLVIACDCDPDRPAYGGRPYDSREPMTWRGVSEGLPRLLDALDAVEAETGQRLNFTWCVRSDLQMSEVHGHAAWAYLEHAELWSRLEERGDELAWHPHLWRWSDSAHCWRQEMQDEEWIVSCLRTGHRALSDALGHPVTTCRMGWEFHNNLTLRTLEELGVVVDISAVPGYRCAGVGGRGSDFHRCNDWSITPTAPYCPSAADYRRPVCPGEKELHLVEIPLWSRVEWRWRALGRLQVRAKHLAKGRLAEALRPEPVFRIPAFTVDPRVFAGAFGQAIRCGKLGAVTVAAFHCDELLNGAGLRGRLYGLAHARRNALFVASRMQTITATEAASQPSTRS